MRACEVWLAEDFLRRQGYSIESEGGKRYAVSDRRRWEIDDWCGHPVEACPPFEPATAEAAA